MVAENKKSNDPWLQFNDYVTARWASSTEGNDKIRTVPIRVKL